MSTSFKDRILRRQTTAESIEWFVEDQCSSPSYMYDLAPPPPSSKLFLFLSLTVCQVMLTTGRAAERGGREGAKSPNHTTTWKPGLLPNHSILSGEQHNPARNSFHRRAVSLFFVYGFNGKELEIPWISWMEGADGWATLWASPGHPASLWR